jgi:peptide/nickel transport system ATP-binding protein
MSLNDKTVLSMSGGCVTFSDGRFFSRRHFTKVALRDVSIAIERGFCLGLVGESGSGKTTLGRCLALLQPLTDGAVFLDGKRANDMPRRQFCRRVQMIFQCPHDTLDPVHSVSAAIAEPLRLHFSQLRGRDLSSRVEELLDTVRLPTSLLGRRPGELSGGQKQRVAIARALAVKPEFLICDEVISALDRDSQWKILELLQKIREREQMALVFISHDLAAVARICPSVAVLHRGQIVERGPTAQVYGHPHHPQTIQLLENEKFFQGDPLNFTLSTCKSRGKQFACSGDRVAEPE